MGQCSLVSPSCFQFFVLLWLSATLESILLVQVSLSCYMSDIHSTVCNPATTQRCLQNYFDSSLCSSKVIHIHFTNLNILPSSQHLSRLSTNNRKRDPSKCEGVSGSWSSCHHIRKLVASLSSQQISFQLAFRRTLVSSGVLLLIGSRYLTHHHHDTGTTTTLPRPIVEVRPLLSPPPQKQESTCDYQPPNAEKSSISSYRGSGTSHDNPTNVMLS